MPPDGGVYGAGILPGTACHNAAVHPGQGVILQLRRQPLVGKIVFRNGYQAGGIPVNPVDDAGPQGPAYAGEGVPAVEQQDTSTVSPPCRR